MAQKPCVWAPAIIYKLALTIALKITTLTEPMVSLKLFLINLHTKPLKIVYFLIQKNHHSTPRQSQYLEGNVFFGNGKDHAGGIRLINAHQIIRNNYMEGLAGIRLGGGFVILNGVPNSNINKLKLSSIFSA